MYNFYFFCCINKNARKKNCQIIYHKTMIKLSLFNGIGWILLLARDVLRQLLAHLAQDNSQLNFKYKVFQTNIRGIENYVTSDQIKYLGGVGCLIWIKFQDSEWNSIFWLTVIHYTNKSRVFAKFGLQFIWFTVIIVLTTSSTEILKFQLFITKYYWCIELTHLFIITGHKTR